MRPGNMHTRERVEGHFIEFKIPRSWDEESISDLWNMSTAISTDIASWSSFNLSIISGTANGGNLRGCRKIK